MISRAFLLIAAMTVSPTAAANSPPDNAVVTATIAALKSGGDSELEWLVSQVGKLQFPGLMVRQKAETFQVLQHCKAKERTRGQAGAFAYYEFEWKCGKGVFVGKLVPDKGGKSVTLVDFLTKAEFEERSRRIPYVMLPPTMTVRSSAIPKLSEAESAAQQLRRKAEMARMINLAGRFAQAATDGDMSDFQQRHSIGSTLTYGFYNPYLEQEFVERFWQLDDDVAQAGRALTEAVALVHNRLGKPVSWTCEDAEPYVDCTWHFADPATHLTSKILVFRPETDIWGIKLFWLRYETDKKLKEAKRRAGR